MKVIKSPNNSLIKSLVRLKKAREREEKKQFIIEGFKEIGMAVRAGIEIETLFTAEDYTSDEHNPETIPCQEIIAVSPAVLERLAYRQHPDGFLAVAKTKTQLLEKISVSANSLVLVLEGIEKPGNVGAMMRTADAAGVSGVILANSGTDLYNPNVIRASLGTVFTNQVAIATTPDAIKWLEANHFTMVLTTPEAKQDYFDLDLSGRLAVIIGSEHFGLTKEWFGLPGHKTKIPMAGQIDSLNASVSAALVIYEIIRQRREKN